MLASIGVAQDIAIKTATVAIIASNGTSAGTSLSIREDAVCPANNARGEA